MLFKSLPEARDFYDNKLNDSAKVFLFDRIGWKTTRMSRTVTIDGFIRFFFTAYPDIKDFTVDELNSITSEESYKAFLKSKGIQVNDDFIREEKEYVKKNIEIPNNQNINGYTQRDVKENEYKPGEKPHMIQLAEEYITNPPEPKMNKSNNIPEVDLGKYKDSPDMLTNTGYTQVISKGPITEESIKIVEENIPEPPKTGIVETAIPVITEAPNIAPQTKKLVPKTNEKESGIADAIIISVIVIVYIAIIVNLVIRIK